MPGAKLVEDNSMEVCFQIPDSSAKSGCLTTLFAELEKFCPHLGVSSYGISDTSLEEVRIYGLVLVLEVWCFLFEKYVLICVYIFTPVCMSRCKH